jgi:hypothetical protein
LNPTPSLPDIITGLAAALAKLKDEAAAYRAKYGAVTTAPQAFVDAVLPAIEAALGDPLYALKVVQQAWADIVSGHPGYNKHHGGGA